MRLKYLLLFCSQQFLGQWQNVHPEKQISNTAIHKNFTQPKAKIGDIQTYLNDLEVWLERRLVSNKLANCQARIRFKVHKSGAVSDINPLSVDSKINELAQKFIQDSSPFPLLPRDCDHDVTIELTFGKAVELKLTGYQAPAFEDDQRIIYEKYMRSLTQKLKHSWMPPKDLRSNTQVSFKIHKDGTFSDLKILQSSGSVGDKAAISAIENASPFERPPASEKCFEDITFTFSPSLLLQDKVRGFIHQNTI